MKLSDLVQDLKIERIIGDVDKEVLAITQNSKTADKGSLFVCIKGFVNDGHKYIPEAIKKGAVAILVQEDTVVENNKITIIKVNDTRKAVALIANRYYDFPSQKVKLVGITGTNGKTTVAYMLKVILEEAQKKVGLLTTVENIIDNQSIDSKMTTMEAIDLQKAFSQMYSCGTDYIIMEVSSHSLSLSRVLGCDFNIAIFTNISDEHFEIHKNFKNYLESKIRLFQYLAESNQAINNKKGIVNIDEIHSNCFLDCLNSGKITYGIDNQCMFHARDIRMDLKETVFTAETPVGDREIKLNMSGKYNIYNALAAIAAAVNEGISLDIIACAFQKFRGAPGRYKMLDYGQPYTIIIDFAHNYHGLEHILKTLNSFSGNRIITIFGHGGERDKRVRKKMGQVVGTYSDYSIITTDNPRSEDPEDISREIEKGLKEVSNCNYKIIIDRVKAIKNAIDIAEKDDIVLIAGKGPEKQQVYHNQTIYHNDEEIVHKIIIEKGFNKCSD